LLEVGMNSGHDYDIFVGLDVGKGEHHACVLDASGRRLHDKPLAQEEAKLAELFFDDRRQAATQVEEKLDTHPLATVLTSMPGVGVRTAARILLEVGDGTAFPTSGHLAAYAGLAPVTRRSGSSIRGEHPPRGGNQHLRRALSLSAFAALHDPASRESA
jgi:transposase